MSGHGHVKPNPDGSKARCGGPALCAVCARERSEAYVVAMAVAKAEAMERKMLERTKAEDEQRHRLDAEWNAAIEAAAGVLDDEFGTGGWLTSCVRRLKREVKP